MSQSWMNTGWGRISIQMLTQDQSSLKFQSLNTQEDMVRRDRRNQQQGTGRCKGKVELQAQAVQQAKTQRENKGLMQRLGGKYSSYLGI